MYEYAHIQWVQSNPGGVDPQIMNIVTLTFNIQVVHHLPQSLSALAKGRTMAESVNTDLGKNYKMSCIEVDLIVSYS